MSEMVNILASIDHYHHHHPPLRLYAGSCVATLTPDVDSHPRYPFIDHQGWVLQSLMSAAVPPWPIHLPPASHYVRAAGVKSDKDMPVVCRCFTDSQLSGSSSRFLPRVRDDLLHIQLEPFLFHQDRRHSVSAKFKGFIISVPAQI